MELSPLHQATEYINRSRKILIALPQHVTVDRLCSAYALGHVLAKLGKELTIASTAVHIPQLDFFGLFSQPLLVTTLSSGPGLVINVSTKNAELDELSYQTDETAVHIFLKPKGEGQFLPEHISIGTTVKPFDLVITIGSQNLEHLGNLYQNHSEVFFETPKINIDIDPGNEYFGTINVIDVTAAAMSEVVAHMISTVESAVTDETAATSLLAGIISSTHSFQDSPTTPKTLTTASDLIAAGARQQDIIKSLYKTKDFSLLKLWGRALARIKTADDISLLYSELTAADFQRTGEGQDRLRTVLHEMLDNVSGFQTVALLAEDGANIKIALAGLPHTNVASIAQKITGTETQPIPLSGLYQGVFVSLPAISLAEAEKKLLAAARTANVL